MDFIPDRRGGLGTNQGTNEILERVHVWSMHVRCAFGQVSDRRPAESSRVTVTRRGDDSTVNRSRPTIWAWIVSITLLGVAIPGFRERAHPKLKWAHTPVLGALRSPAGASVTASELTDLCRKASRRAWSRRPNIASRLGRRGTSASTRSWSTRPRRSTAFITSTRIRRSVLGAAALCPEICVSGSGRYAFTRLHKSTPDSAIGARRRGEGDGIRADRTRGRAAAGSLSRNRLRHCDVLSRTDDGRRFARQAGQV